MNNKLVSLVVPCFNEEEVIHETVTQIHNFCNENSNYDFEVLFVDDGSSDGTAKLLESFVEKYANVVVLLLSRNFGHQIAVTAGLDAAKGDAVVVMDADLQDPIEVVALMLQEWEKGADVVYGVRSLRQGESKFKIWTAKVFYRVLNKLSSVHIPIDTGDFRLMDRKVVSALSLLPESQRFIRGMVAWVGFTQVPIYYQREPRFAGTSKYPFRKMVAFAVDGVLSFSNQPLRLATHLGVALAIFSFLIALCLIYLGLTTPELVPGWASTLTAIFFLGGVQLTGLGILGEYIGRIYSEVKRRPLYLIEKEFNSGQDSR